MNKKRKALYIGLIIVVVIVAVIVGISVSHKNRTQTNTQSSVEKIELLEGTLESDEVDISSKIPGRISQMLVDEGDLVKAGQTVAYLESKEVDAKVSQAEGMYNAALAQQAQAGIGVSLQKKTVLDQITQAQAGYKAAKAKLQEALNGARPQEIAQAKAAVEQAQAAYNTAKTTYDRFHGLYKDGVIPKQQEDEIELKYLSAKAQKEATEAKLNLVEEGARKEDIEQARQGVKAAAATLQMAKDAALQVGLRQQDVVAASQKAFAAQGQVNEAKAYQSETKIIAPISGYVSQRMSESGEMVSAGFPILTITKSRDFKVKVYADESKFGKLRLHDPVKVVIPALDKEVDARVARVSQAADFATKKATNEQGSFDVRSLEIVVKISQDEPDFRNGMTARVKLHYLSGTR